jgi:hypothetical protein
VYVAALGMTSVLFGSLPIPSQGGDRLVSKAVTTAISALFRRTDQLEATVRAEPVAKLLQGSVDGFDLLGNGLEMYNGLRIEALELYLQAVSIDFGAIFRGAVSLRQPTQATMRVVLTEADLTTSFNTPFVVGKLQRLQFDGQSFGIRNTQMQLNADKTLGIQSQIQIGDGGDWTDIDLTAALEVEGRTRLQFVEVTYKGNEAAIALGQALVAHVNNLLDLDTFALDGTRLRVDRVRLLGKQIIFYGVAHIDHFPQRTGAQTAASAA